MGSISDALKKIGARELAGGGYEIASKPTEPKPDKGVKDSEISRAKAPFATGSAGEDIQESDYSLREFWPDETFTSSDGAFTLIVKPIKRITLVSGTSIRFKEPV
jgi:hypothetical protein